jgi:hypothetical protein
LLTCFYYHTSTGKWEQLSVESVDESFVDFKVKEFCYLVFGRQTTYIDAESGFPERFALCQNYPNPFNPETRIGYQLPKAGNVEIVVFDVLGKNIRTLVNMRCDAGFFDAIWDGRDDSGNRLGSGLYVVQMKTKEFMAMKKVVMIK